MAERQGLLRLPYGQPSQHHLFNEVRPAVEHLLASNADKLVVYRVIETELTWAVLISLVYP